MEVFLSTDPQPQQPFLQGLHRPQWAAVPTKKLQLKRGRGTRAKTSARRCHKTTSVRFATSPWPTRKSSPPTFEATTRSNPHPIPMIPPAKPKFIIAASAARCCPPSVRWTDTCLSILASVLSHANVVDKLSRPTATCIDTRGPTEPETLARATEAAEPAPMEANNEDVSAASGRRAWSSRPQPSAP